jgi:hypothetical protein
MKSLARGAALMAGAATVLVVGPASIAAAQGPLGLSGSPGQGRTPPFSSRLTTRPVTR